MDAFIRIVTSLAIVFFASANWYVATVLIRADRKVKPRLKYLHERAILAIAAAISGTIGAFLWFNFSLVLHIIPQDSSSIGDTLRAISAIAVSAPSLYWLYLFRSDRGSDGE